GRRSRRQALLVITLDRQQFGLVTLTRLDILLPQATQRGLVLLADALDRVVPTQLLLQSADPLDVGLTVLREHLSHLCRELVDELVLLLHLLRALIDENVEHLRHADVHTQVRRPPTQIEDDLLGVSQRVAVLLVDLAPGLAELTLQPSRVELTPLRFGLKASRLPALSRLGIEALADAGLELAHSIVAPGPEVVVVGMRGRPAVGEVRTLVL